MRIELITGAPNKESKELNSVLKWEPSSNIRAGMLSILIILVLLNIIIADL